MIWPAAVACTVSGGSFGSGRSGAGFSAASVAYRPAATAATPAPSKVVAAAAAVVRRRISPSVGGEAAPGQRACPAG
ncbi:hypothetical protein SSPO_074120 [Streptomyces antimycoticus]|uniref:Uncharacterized protein n=1 Tax=Streptomyces antimycoticus TaxID=68175 RepID=A0A499URX7_9ACTN|nr:hypothetical protein SSPO_074120 [Streptomyces antimycoticus]